MKYAFKTRLSHRTQCRRDVHEQSGLRNLSTKEPPLPEKGHMSQRWKQ
jgi:hypothetical protein